MPNTTRDYFLSWLKLFLSPKTYRIRETRAGKTLSSAVLGEATPETDGYEISLERKPENAIEKTNQLFLTVNAEVFDSANTEEIVARILATNRVVSVMIHLPDAPDNRAVEYNFTAKSISDDDFENDRHFLNRELIEKWQLIPLRRVGSEIFLAAVIPHNEMADDVRIATGFNRITIYCITPTDFKKYYGVLAG